ncbi:biotin-dependent carboxyltransferase family protein [Aeromicrobium sp. Leaf350]|uniref:5-oxoprolinase subunit C family protein n=1 Tax=Aeromicrobium sp. Leaf350 TaxID=2876565 RepID=UPI001E4696FF|nr:biotin-dependent carboxyltransferase family protein [Aeromicrobium sp. Leaf350]
MSLRVTALTGSALVQDTGRPGRTGLGVTPSGSFDRNAARQANVLLGNPPDAAVLEVVGSVTVRATRATAVAVTGAPGPVQCEGIPVDTGQVLLLQDGDELTVGPPALGVRRVLAVAGGLTPDPVLGSRATDTLSGLGPAPVTVGTLLPVGLRTGHPVTTRIETGVLGVGDLTVRLVLGPRDDWFTPEAVSMLLGTGWTVSPRSDRIGVRLDGPSLERAVAGELESEPVVRGSVQVTTAGLPVVLGPDHPVTGGYPVIGVVVDADTDLLAQAAPGRRVRFRRHPAP